MSKGVTTKVYNCLSCGSQLYFKSSDINSQRCEKHWSKAIMECETCDITYGDPEVLKGKAVIVSGTIGGKFDGVYKVKIKSDSKK